VRGLQTHKAKIERAVPGSRVAMNLSGVETGQLRRGMVVSHPGVFRPTSFMDARFQHLPDADLPLKHNAEVKFFVGASEVPATVRLLETDLLAPGASGWVQLALAEPVVVLKGDRFILRRPSPGATLGGGVVVDPHSRRRHRRMDLAVITQLETLAKGAPGEMLLQALEALGPASVKDAIQKAGLTGEVAQEALAEVQSDLIQLDGDALVASRSVWDTIAHDIGVALSAYYAAHPLRMGMPREELKSRLRFLRLSPKAFNAVLERANQIGLVVASGNIVCWPGHTVKFSPAQQAKVDALLADFRRDPHNTPSFKDCAARVDDEVLAALIEQGALTPVSPEVLFLAETYDLLVQKIKAHLRAHGKITVAEVRDMFSTSRKYALALMEYLDTQGITKRVGDERVLRG
jgi:selenocysteine-specific elongation factor